MVKILKKLPLPITGLMLGFAALGNLLQSYSNGLRNIFGIFSAIILIMVTLKIAMFPKGVREALENPVVASVFPTLSMTIMLLATYLKPLMGPAAIWIWYLGVVLHILLILWFSKKFVSNFNIKKVFPSWFIVYVGIAVASVSAPAFEAQALGKILFWFALLSYLILLPIILKRIFIVREIPKPALPTIAIMAAPASLCLAGYMSSFDEKNMAMVIFLLLVSQITYLAVIGYLPKLLNLNFMPSFSGFTFPIVISGIGLKLTNGFLVKSGNIIAPLKILVNVEEIIALVLVLYVFANYIKFLLTEDKSVVQTN